MADQNICYHSRLNSDTEQICGYSSTEKMREQTKATSLVYSPRRNGKTSENDGQTSRKSKSSALAKGSDSSTSSLCLFDEKQKRKSLQPLQLSADGQKLSTCGSHNINGRRTKNKKKVTESRESRSRQSKIRIPMKIHEESAPSSSSEQETTSGSSSNEACNTERATSSDEAHTLMVQGSAPEKYWEILAEERRKALEETLEENMKLYQLIEELKEENRILKEKANNTDYFATMYKVAKVPEVSEGENDADE